MPKRSILVWDLPIRLFHWSLLVLVVAAFVSGQLGGNLIVWHGRCGLAIAGLLVFRLLWGVFGSTHARFASFVPGPQRLLAYVRGQWQGVGHNPLGALSVLGLLAVLALQTTSGLFANDDIAFEGPLAALVSKELSDWLSGLHRQNVVVLIALVVLHIAAILFYARVKQDNLVKPMITGYKDVSDPGLQPARGGGLPAFVCAVLIAAAAVWVAGGGLLSPPPPPPAVTPAW